MGSTQKQVGSQTRIYALEMQDYYANSVQIATTVNDFSLIFGRSKITEGTEKSINVQEVYERRVYLSPQQAKALSKILVDQVQGYEKTYGEINIVPKKNK